MEKITLKFKMADAQQVEGAVVAAIRSEFCHDDVVRNQAAWIWRTVNRAMVEAGCVLIQLDNTDG